MVGISKKLASRQAGRFFKTLHTDVLRFYALMTDWQGLMSAAYESGLKVGHGAEFDLRIAGHDDHPFSRYTCPSLTTISQDYDAIGERSVSEMLKIIDGANGITERTEKLFEGRLVMRSSA